MEVSCPLTGNDYLPSISVNAVDYSSKISEIEAKYGDRYFGNVDAIREASKLWRIPCNDSGVVTDLHDQFVITGKNYSKVEVRVARSANYYCLIGVDTQTSISGFSYAPSVFSSLGYRSVEDARLAGIYEAGQYLNGRLENSCINENRSYVRQVKDLLEKLQDAMQPKLF